MSFPKPCHKPFRKLTPPFTLTELTLVEWVFSVRKRLRRRNWTPFAHITGVNSGLLGGVNLLSADFSPSDCQTSWPSDLPD